MFLLQEADVIGLLRRVATRSVFGLCPDVNLQAVMSVFWHLCPGDQLTSVCSVELLELHYWCNGGETENVSRALKAHVSDIKIISTPPLLVIIDELPLQSQYRGQKKRCVIAPDRKWRDCRRWQYPANTEHFHKIRKISTVVMLAKNILTMFLQCYAVLANNFTTPKC